MNLPTVKELERAFTLARIPSAEARSHAVRMADDLTRFPIEGFRLLPLDCVSAEIGLVEYQFGRTAYSINNAKPEDAPRFKPSDHGGTQLDRENLLFLARASQIAHATTPELWLKPDAELTGQVTSPRQHLDTLNEFWWLSRWRPGATIERAYQLNPKCGMNIDWRLSWDMGFGSPLTVNLEVKRRVGGDVLRSVQGCSLNPDDLFAPGLEDKHGNSKFRQAGKGEINVLGLTLLGEINREVQERAFEWINTRSDIDAVLLFSRFSLQRCGFDPHIVRNKELLAQVMIRELDPLDRCLHGRISKPLPIPLSQLPFLY